MNKMYLLIAVILSLIVVPVSAQSTTMHGFLSQYNVTGITSSTNLTYSGMNYTLVWIGQKHMLINTTDGYSFVTSPGLAANVTHTYLIENYYPNQSVITDLSNSLMSYKTDVYYPLRQCLGFTGLLYTSCTYQNGCRSCYDVDYCTETLDGYGNSFQYGIMNFSDTYTTFNTSYTQFLNLSSNINESNYGSTIQKMYAAILNVSTSTHAMPHSDIFPVKNVTQAQLNACPYHLVSTPWYCGARYIGGFCNSIPFNYTKIAGIVSQVQELKNLPVYSETMASFANQSVYTAHSYLDVYNNLVNLDKFNSMMGNVLPLYNSTVENATFLTNRIQDPELSSLLSILESNFTTVKDLTYNQNISAANVLIHSLISNVLTEYGNASALYLPMYNMSVNGTHKLLLQKLDYMQGKVPQHILDLMSAQSNITAELANQITYAYMPTLASNVSEVYNKISDLSTPFSMPNIVKGSDYWFVGAVLSGSSSSVGSTDQIAPYLAAVLSFIFAIIISLIVYYAYSSSTSDKNHGNNGSTKRSEIRKARRMHPGSKASHKHGSGIKLSKKSSLIIILVVFILLYTFLTLYFAQQANSFIPMEYFINHVHSSNTLALSINSTAYAPCINALNASLNGSGTSIMFISAPVSQDLSPVLLNKLANGTGTYDFNVANNTLNMSVSYTATNSTGSISVKDPSGKTAAEFILNGGPKEKGEQSIVQSNGITTGTWVVSYNTTGAAALTISSSKAKQNSTGLTYQKAISEGIPIVVHSNTTIYKGMLGYIMYANDSMLTGSSCTLASILK